LSGMWIDSVRERKPIHEVILDMDSSVSETYGEQEGSAYNGHFGCTCYHPLFCFNQFGDLERALLRNGNVASAHDWRSVLEPVVARYRTWMIKKLFRGDAGFANPEVYVFLEAESYLYAIRLPANPVLYRAIQHLMTRPVGPPRPAQGPEAMSVKIIQDRLDSYGCHSTLEEEQALREITQEILLAALGRTDFFQKAG